MRFYDREEEMEALKRFRRVAVLGRRRVGKTRLVEETFRESLIKLFVNAEKSDRINALDWVKEIRGRGLYAPELASMSEVVEFLLRFYPNRVVFIDEIQNALKVNASFIYDLQRLMDEFRDRRIVITGSYLSVAKRIVEDYRSPLHGRFDTVIRLRELNMLAVMKIGMDLGLSPEDAAVLYLVFGGIPKYYETLEDLRMKPAEFIEFMFFRRPFPMQEEVRMMLREEFGKEYKMYFSVLQAIAEGHVRLGEIGGFVGVRSNELSKYMYNLEREFGLIRRLKPRFLRARSIYEITANLYAFWFRYVWKHYPLEDNFRRALADFRATFNEYLGRRFEAAFRDAELLEAITGRRLSYVGKEFGRVGRDTVDFDVVAVDEAGEPLIFEVKFSELSGRDVDRIADSLRRRAKACGFENATLGIIAKRIGGRRPGLLLVDLGDIASIAEHRVGVF